ncbi:MAG: signal peptide peptidase SppA [Desulfotomaculales bacterium]
MRKRLLAGVVFGIVLLSLVVAAVFGARGGVPGRVASGEAVGIVRIEGVIVGGERGDFLGATLGAEDVAAQLRRAAEDPSIRAVVLRLNSPGGSAAAAQEIGQEVDRLRQAGKKVVASMGDTAASGAYWIAAKADRIVANPATITGSIGVIIQTQHLVGLYEKLGIDTETVKSGPHKDMGSPARPLTPEERRIFQGMVDDIYDQFVAVVAAGRKMEESRVRQLADGRVFTGNQAKELGLVDEMGDLQDAVRLAGRLAGIRGEPRVVELGPRAIWRSLFGGGLNGAYGTHAWLLLWPPVGQF